MQRQLFVGLIFLILCPGVSRPSEQNNQNSQSATPRYDITVRFTHDDMSVVPDGLSPSDERLVPCLQKDHVFLSSMHRANMRIAQLKSQVDARVDEYERSLAAHLADARRERNLHNLQRKLAWNATTERSAKKARK